MKLFDILLGRKKKTQHIGQKCSAEPQRHPATRKLNSAKAPSPKQSAAGRAVRQMQDPFVLEPDNVRRRVCQDDSHHFVSPHPLTCSKCGLMLRRNEQQIRRYMGSYFDGVSYQWSLGMKREDIRSFSISCGNRPVFSVICDFSKLTIRNSLHGSRDGWRQSQYPQDYFEPRDVRLEAEDARKLRAVFRNCNFFAWKTPVHYVENHDAPGFSVDKSFRCTFTDGKQFVCLDPNNEEFDYLVTLIREIAEKRASKDDSPFIQRILEDTGRKEKHIYWLISSNKSMDGKWMDLLEQGVPFFNYTITRELRYGENANAELMVNVIHFSDGAVWATPRAVPESEYHWETLPLGNRNDLGAAFDLLTQHFEKLPEPGRKLFPIVAVVLDGPITDDWLAAQKRFQSLPGVDRNVLTIVLALGDKVENRFLKNFDGVVYNINSMDDIINELDSPLFGM